MAKLIDVIEKLEGVLDRRIEGDPELRKLVGDAYEEGARVALCLALDRLGADGIVCYLNNMDSSEISDEIYRHVRWLEDMAVQHALNNEKLFPNGRDAR